MDATGCALTGPLLTPDEAAHVAGLYDDDTRFRATIDMARYRVGLGEYRYFTPPIPDAISELKEALYPRLLPIAREWWARPEPPDPVAGHPAGEARLVQPASTTRAGSSFPTSSALALSRRRPPSSSRTYTGWSSPQATGPSAPRAAGPPPPCGTASPSSAPASA